MRIVSRAEWGARYDRGVRAAYLPSEGVWLHHDTMGGKLDDPYGGQRQLEKIGESRFGYGISYTFTVWPDGTIMEGHGVEREGTHTTGGGVNYNKTHRAIVLHGNYQTDQVTPAAIDACAWLLVHGFFSGWWKTPHLVGGHRDVKATACPGNNAYAAIPSINALVDALLTPPPPPPQEDEEMKWIVRAPTGAVYICNGETLRTANSPVYRSSARLLGALTPNPDKSVDTWFEWTQEVIDSYPIVTPGA